MKVAVVGATGLVGQMMCRVLEERRFPITQFIPVASGRSVGKTIIFHNAPVKVAGIEQALRMAPDVALFSAGSAVSLQWAPEFEKIGCWVIDNSSAWRMHPDCALVVPEINPHHLEHAGRIIANPNCSTIQMVLALSQVHTAFKIKRIVVSTYQSVSGSGAKGIQQLQAERSAGGYAPGNAAYPYRIDMNVIPQVDIFLENGYSKEEMKMHNETRKIYGDDTLMVSATTVRVPVSGGHSESVNVECEQPFTREEIVRLMQATEGVSIEDDLQQPLYPMPIHAEGKDTVFVGRIRMDYSQPNTFNCWIVADNLRKGAATNAVQIAELLINTKRLSL